MRGQLADRGIRGFRKSSRSRRSLDGSDSQRLSVVVNDYAGHPFQVDLSRELAGRGFVVQHAYCSTNVTPRGDLSNDQEHLEIVGLSTGSGFEKYDAKKRLVAEIRYGLSSALLLVRRRPAVTLNSNVPIVSLAIISAVAKVLGIPNVLWLQDFQAGLIAMVLDSERHPIYRAMAWLERQCIKSADHVVTISDGFEREAIATGQDPSRVTTIPNWAPIDELPLVDKDNPWATEQGLSDRTVYLYSGTLGMKHRPEALRELSLRLRLVDPDAIVLVISESVGVEWLTDQRSVEEPMENLRILPFQPFEQLPSVLGSADVLVCLLERDAGEFSVPSKVLTYLCAGRAVLGLMPENNAATRLVVDQAKSGLVAAEMDAFLDHAEALALDRSRRETYGTHARSFAEKTFPIEAIADLFQHLFSAIDDRFSPAAGALVDDLIQLDDEQVERIAA